MKKLLKYLIIIVSTISIVSCNLFNDPETFNNVQTETQEIKPLLLNNFNPGDTINGTLSFEFFPDEILSNIEKVMVINDLHFFFIEKKLPFNFEIDTRWWKNGENTFYIGVYLNNSDLGLLEYFNEPSVKYYIQLVFQHPPLLPENQGKRTLNSDNNYNVTITWESPIIDDVDYFIIEFFASPTNIIRDSLSANLTQQYEIVLSQDYNYYRVGAGNEYGLTISDLTYIAVYSFNKLKR